jgi:hypothetical protein
VCFVAGCLEVPVYYWAKHGITQEQIRKDNTFCADMTAEKPSAYARGARFTMPRWIGRRISSVCNRWDIEKLPKTN